MEYHPKIGLKGVQKHASQPQFCMICLESSKKCKLYPANRFALDAEYEQLTGISLQHEMQFKPWFCTECAQRLDNCHRFRTKCLTAYHLLLGIVQNHGALTVHNLNAINKKEKQLASNITKKVFVPDHCDRHFVEVVRNIVNENKTQEKNVKAKGNSENTDTLENVNCKVELNSNNDISDSVTIIPENVIDNDKVLNDNFCDKVLVSNDNNIDTLSHVKREIERTINNDDTVIPKDDIYNDVEYLDDIFNDKVLSKVRKSDEERNNYVNEHMTGNNNSKNSIVKNLNDHIEILDDNAMRILAKGEESDEERNKYEYINEHLIRNNSSKDSNAKNLNDHIQVLDDNVMRILSKGRESNKKKHKQIEDKKSVGKISKPILMKREKKTNIEDLNRTNDDIQNTSNDMDSDDYDFDIDFCDDINYDMGNTAVIEKEKINNNKTQLTNIDGNPTAYMMVYKGNKQIESGTQILVRNKPIEKISSEDNLKLQNVKRGQTKRITETKQIESGTQIRVENKPVKKISSKDNLKNVKRVQRKRIRKKQTSFEKFNKVIPSTKIELKFCKEIELTYEQQKAEIMKRQESDNYKTSRYKCKLCFKGFSFLVTYTAHMDKHSDKFGLIECDICRLRFKSKCTLTKHIYGHKSMYKCTKCNFASTHRTAVIYHERWHNGKIYQCKQCEKTFTKNTSLMTHVRLKHPSHVCTQCGFSFIGARGLHLHMLRKHTPEDTQNSKTEVGPLCEPCNIRFASGKAYMRHMQASLRHAPFGENLHNCVRMNKKTMIDCEYCGIKLEGIDQYKSHLKTQHPGKIRTQFPKDKVRIDMPQEKRVKPKANAMCEKCGKTFKCLTDLETHMHYHTGVKPFKCDICDRRYMTKWSVGLHISTHSDNPERVQCPVCCKSFSHAGNLKRHMAVHQPVRSSYKCDFCGKSYTSAPGLQMHISHVHHKVPWPKKVNGKRTRDKRRRSIDTRDSED